MLRPILERFRHYHSWWFGRGLLVLALVSLGLSPKAVLAQLKTPEVWLNGVHLTQTPVFLEVRYDDPLPLWNTPALPGATTALSSILEDPCESQAAMQANGWSIPTGTWTTGWIGNGLLIDANASALARPLPWTSSPADGSLAFWIAPEWDAANHPAKATLFYLNDSFYAELDQQKIQWYVGRQKIPEKPAVYQTDISNWLSQQWHHLAFTWQWQSWPNNRSGYRYTIFLDGQILGRSLYFDNGLAAGDDIAGPTLYLGARPMLAGFTGQIQARLDDISLMRGALSAPELAQLTGPICGNQICSATEDPQSCPEDCNQDVTIPLLPPKAPVKDWDSPFCVHNYYTTAGEPWDTLYRELGAKYVRMGFIWDGFVTKDGFLNFDKQVPGSNKNYRDFIRKIKQQNMVPLLYLMPRFPGKTLRSTTTPCGKSYSARPIDLAEWQEHVRLLVERYDGDDDTGCNPAVVAQNPADCYTPGDKQFPGEDERIRVKYWQVGNEPTFTAMNGFISNDSLKNRQFNQGPNGLAYWYWQPGDGYQVGLTEGSLPNSCLINGQETADKTSLKIERSDTSGQEKTISVYSALMEYKPEYLSLLNYAMFNVPIKTNLAGTPDSKDACALDIYQYDESALPFDQNGQVDTKTGYLTSNSEMNLASKIWRPQKSPAFMRSMICIAENFVQPKTKFIRLVLQYKGKYPGSCQFDNINSGLYDWFGTAEEYFEYWKATSEAIKAADPQSLVVSAILEEYVLDKFLKWAKQNGGSPQNNYYYDRHDFHLYGDPLVSNYFGSHTWGPRKLFKGRSIEDKIARILEVYQRNNIPSKPFTTTESAEINYLAGNPDDFWNLPATDQRRQAEGMLKRYLKLLRLNFETACWFSLVQTADNESAKKPPYMSLAGLVRQDGQRLLSYSAYQSMTKYLDQLVFNDYRTYQIGNKQLQVYEFANAERKVLALWLNDAYGPKKFINRLREYYCQDKEDPLGDSVDLFATPAEKAFYCDLAFKNYPDNWDQSVWTNIRLLDEQRDIRSIRWIDPLYQTESPINAEVRLQP
jgi:hypothetical protein